MNDKEVQDLDKKQPTTPSKDGTESNNEIWSFCPVCGVKIPHIQRLMFCMNCGTNLEYLKEHRKLEQQKIINPYIKPSLYPPTYPPPIIYRPKKLSDDEIIDTKNHKLWGTMASIGVPLGAFLLMNFLSAGIIMAIIIYFPFNFEALYNFLLNPYFIIISSFFELIFILIPVLYVAKYLQNPSIENRLALLGFTIRGFERKRIFKEILIGLGFAVIAVLLVTLVSFLTEIIVEILFGIDIVGEISGTTGDVEFIIKSSDILDIVLLSLVMILIIGTSEEILFRGFMQKGLMHNLGNKAGIIITAFTFAIIHVVGIILMLLDAPLILLISFLLSFIPYFAISLLLGLIYYWRNENLIAVIITHGLYNALTIIQAFFFYNLF
ncbi:MAG: CPBP family intramembrane glutamic endopeptidase [Candidatus Hodarchaeota archaeon]